MSGYLGAWELFWQTFQTFFPRSLRNRATLLTVALHDLKLSVLALLTYCPLLKIGFVRQGRLARRRFGCIFEVCADNEHGIG